MSNAEANDPKNKQTEQTAQSPIKTPGTETAHVKMSDAAIAATGGEAHAGANAMPPLMPIPRSVPTACANAVRSARMC